MKTAILSSVLILASLAGCHQPASQQNGAAPVATPTPDYLKRINGLSPKQRDVTFFRAIDDAGFDCQDVTSSEARDKVQGYPAWVAHCSDGRDWVVILQEGGMIQVATPEQLRGEQAPPPKPPGATANQSGR